MSLQTFNWLIHILICRGHRRESFQAEDLQELVEIRARQRTFHGAYSRTALGALGYALTILRLFEPDFQKSMYPICLYDSLDVLHIDDVSYSPVGIVFSILGGLMFILAFFRNRHSKHDFADRHKEAHKIDNAIKTKGQEGSRIFGRPFVTAGWIVVQVTFITAATEIALLVLILRHPIAVRRTILTRQVAY